MKITQSIRVWWESPVTPQMRWRAVIVAMFGGFWISFLMIMVGFFYFNSDFEMTLSIYLYGVLVGTLIFMLLSYYFPKVILLLTFPFSTWGIGY